MSKKAIIYCIGILLIILLAITLIGQTLFKKEKDITSMEYRTDKKPIEDRLPDLPSFTSCYWKADAIGNTNFGPTNYWMKGFAILNDSVAEQLMSDYEWASVKTSFIKGMNPEITGKEDFVWKENTTFTSKIIKQKFVGRIYLDVNNGIIYFDLENT